jgi:hypothetical protein
VRHLVATVLIWLAATLGWADATVVEVIDLRYRDAQEVVPVLQPLAGPGGSVSAIGNRLVIRAAPRAMADIRKVLAAVDRRPQRLVITARQDLAFDTGGSAADVRGAVPGTGAGVRPPGSPGAVGDEGDGPSGRAGARVYGSQAAGADRGGQTVQVLEGNVAHIAIGQSVPVSTRRFEGGRVVETIVYRDVVTGFLVRPRVSGDRVTLELAAERDRITDPRTGTVGIRHVETVLTGRLGEWLEVGGATRAAEQDESAIAYRSTQAAVDVRRIYVKVDPLP